MRRYLGFFPQQFGDLYMNTVAARYLKHADPEAHITLMIAGDYRDCAPLFIDQPHIDRIHILNSPRDRLSPEDFQWIESQRFHVVFNPFADHDHSRPWWKERIQTHEVAHVHGIPIPAGDDGKIEMTRWFTPTKGLENHVAFAPFPGYYAGLQNGKTLSIERAQQIVDLIRDEGYEVLQVGGKDEPYLNGVTMRDTDYFTSVKNVLGCKLFVGGDSGLTWLMSGYDFPTLALYSSTYYGEFVRNIQPVNSRAVYLSSDNVNDENLLDNIRTSLKNLLT